MSEAVMIQLHVGGVFIRTMPTDGLAYIADSVVSAARPHGRTLTVIRGDGEAIVATAAQPRPFNVARYLPVLSDALRRRFAAEGKAA